MIENITYAKYHNFTQTNFTLNGHNGTIIAPNCQIAHDLNGKNKWIWRTEFLGAFDSVDIAMLEKGYFLLYYQVSDMYGCPASIDMFKNFYDVVTYEYNLSCKTILFGFSRGGLYAVNFAVSYPNIIDKIYLDAPVIDIASWPGGIYSGVGSQNEYLDCLKLYGLTNDTACKYKDGLLEKFSVLANNNIPIVIVAGDSDSVVPHKENCELLVNYYNKYNKNLLYILKEGIEHHPHSLEEPRVVVEFLVVDR